MTRPAEHGLTPQELAALWERRSSGDESARALLAKTYRYFVRTRAESFKSKHPEAELDDLCGYGSLGLLKAIDKFDPARTSSFAAYATLWVDNEIVRGYFGGEMPVRVPEHARLLKEKAAKAAEALAAELGRTPTLDEVRAKLHLSDAEVEMTRDALGIGGGRGGDDKPAFGIKKLIEMIGADPTTSALEEDGWGAALREIGSRERMILEYRAGLHGGKPRTLRDVGARMNLTGERVRQIEIRALVRLRRVAKRSGLIP